jgi:integrase
LGVATIRPPCLLSRALVLPALALLCNWTCGWRWCGWWSYGFGFTRLRIASSGADDAVLGLCLEGTIHMTITTTTLERLTDDVFSDLELRTLAGFLGGYSGLTRDAYALDLRQFAQWCHDRHIALFAVVRGDIEAFARNLEDRGRARATISRRLCTITCLYKYAVEEGFLDRSPAVHVRRPRLDYESNATGLDRNEVGAMLVAAGLAGARDHALISLLALNGLRV